MAETLNQRLAREGLTTRAGQGPGRRDIMRGDEVVMPNATAGEVWDWLRKRARERAAIRALARAGIDPSPLAVRVFAGPDLPRRPRPTPRGW